MIETVNDVLKDIARIRTLQKILLLTILLQLLRSGTVSMLLFKRKTIIDVLIIYLYHYFVFMLVNILRIENYFVNMLLGVILFKRSIVKVSFM